MLPLKRRAILMALLAMTVLPIAQVAGCGGGGRTPLKVLCAGSLMVPFERIEEEYETRHPDIDVIVEGHGSIQVIRHVTELDARADVMAVADHSLIPMMMYGNQVAGTTSDYATWYVRFATNRVGVAYTSQSKYADEITSANWYDILSRPDIKLGFSDPRIDSCGYRALMLCQLAEGYYNDDAILEKVMGDFSPPLTVMQEDDVTVISVPEVLKPRKVTIRGSSVVLLGLLDSGDLDYAFEYESVAKQHGLGFVELPPEIDLSSRSLAEAYGHVMVRLDFQRFASVTPEFLGEPIVYGLSIPATASHSEAAEDFIEFLLGPDGYSLLGETYHPPLVPPEADNPGSMPPALKAVFEGR
jgi:molybdate/tungstate transport system substrate-binding protein